jgi:hypothetical protein
LAPILPQIVNNPKISALLRNFVIELVLYGGLMLVYFVIVLRWLGEPLVSLFLENPTLYAPIGLVLILLQGVALEAVTSFLVARLGLERLE